MEQAKIMANFIDNETKTYQPPPNGELGMAAED